VDASALVARIAADKRAYRDEWLAHVPPANSSRRVNPARFFEALDRRLDADAIVVADDGNHTFLCAELLPTPAGRRFVSPTDFNCMGYCVPAAIGAKLASPSRTVVGIVGDGAFLMTGLETLNAASRGLGIPFFVFADGELAQIAQAQQIPFGRKVCTALSPLDYGAFAAATGCDYVGIAEDAALDGGLDRAFDAARRGRPTIVEVRIDYSRKTRFTKGVVATNLRGFALRDQVRFVGRALWRRVTA
jgi:acetolactate synthase-1/2/3 large subunit